MTNDEFIERVAVMRMRRDEEMKAIEKSTGKKTFSNDRRGIRRFEQESPGG